MLTKAQASVAGVVVAVFFAGIQLAEAHTIAPLARWGGQTGKVGSGGSGYFCNQDDLRAFWKEWKIAQREPDINFDRELAVFYMGSGATLKRSMSRRPSRRAIPTI